MKSQTKTTNENQESTANIGNSQQPKCPDDASALKSVRSRLAKSKDLIADTLRTDGSAKKLLNLQSPSSAVKSEFLTINQRIDRLFKFISKEKSPSKNIASKKKQSSFNLSKNSSKEFKSTVKGKNIKSKHSKSSSDVNHANFNHQSQLLQKKLERTTTQGSQSPGKRVNTSASKPRVSPFGVKTSIKAFGLKNLTIKNIVFNENPKPNSVKQAEPYEVSALRPPKTTQQSFLDFHNLIPNKNHHTRVRSMYLESSKTDQRLIEDQNQRL